MRGAGPTVRPVRRVPESTGRSPQPSFSRPRLISQPCREAQPPAHKEHALLVVLGFTPPEKEKIDVARPGRRELALLLSSH